MLLIWDIHITSKRKESIISAVREYIFSEDDDSIVFLWDFVYHFNYDRKALMWMYNLFLECFENNKHVYILAWNHDRISWHFVYEEAQKAFDFVKGNDWSLDFITEPVTYNIQWQDCLFFPYYLPDQEQEILPQFEELWLSTNQKEQRSARANSRLFSDIATWKKNKSWDASTSKSEKLWIFHHRYTVSTQFPGQFAQFGYKSPWLSNALFDDTDIVLCSGHLHHPFCYKNYLCIGSIWHTSPLEINQTKFFFRLDPKTQNLVASPVSINPYIHIPLDELSWDQKVSEAFVQEFMKTRLEENIWHLHAGDLDIVVENIPSTYNLKQVTLTCIGEKSYAELSEIVQESMYASMADIRIKKQKRSLPDMLNVLDTESKQLDQRIGDWKTLLHSYITQKYEWQSQEYIQELEDIGILV